LSARILIIEDNATNMELMVYLLKAFGYEPLLASDGEAGIKIARQQTPDLILCDIHLPKLDGYGVIAVLRTDPGLSAVPIIAVTALAMVGDREKLLASGFDGYIEKPIEPETIISQIEAFLAKKPAGLDQRGN
jgi:CheY-like chemotaxis protein